MNTPDWISVKDRLPEPGNLLVVRTSDNDYMTAFFDFIVFWSFYDDEPIPNVTHWIALPVLPPDGGDNTTKVE